jgi:hypothetical protein
MLLIANCITAAAVVGYLAARRVYSERATDLLPPPPPNPVSIAHTFTVLHLGCLISLSCVDRCVVLCRLPASFSCSRRRCCCSCCSAHTCRSMSILTRNKAQKTVLVTDMRILQELGNCRLSNRSCLCAFESRFTSMLRLTLPLQTRDLIIGPATEELVFRRLRVLSRRLFCSRTCISPAFAHPPPSHQQLLHCCSSSALLSVSTSDCDHKFFTPLRFALGALLSPPRSLPVCSRSLRSRPRPPLLQQVIFPSPCA